MREEGEGEQRAAHARGAVGAPLPQQQPAPSSVSSAPSALAASGSLGAPATASAPQSWGLSTEAEPMLASRVPLVCRKRAVSAACPQHPLLPLTRDRGGPRHRPPLPYGTAPVAAMPS